MFKDQDVITVNVDETDTSVKTPAVTGDRAIFGL